MASLVLCPASLGLQGRHAACRRGAALRYVLGWRFTRVSAQGRAPALIPHVPHVCRPAPRALPAGAGPRAQPQRAAQAVRVLAAAAPSAAAQVQELNTKFGERACRRANAQLQVLITPARWAGVQHPAAPCLKHPAAAVLISPCFKITILPLRLQGSPVLWRSGRAAAGCPRWC